MKDIIWEEREKQLLFLQQMLGFSSLCQSEPTV